MSIKAQMAQKRVLFLPLILVAGIIPIALASINATRQMESTPIFIADPKDLLSSQEILFENLNTISADQKKLSFVTAEDYGMKNNKIWLTNADGSNPEIIAKADGSKFVSNPIFSPDSTNLAFIRTYPFQIWTYNIQTGRLTNLEPDEKRLEKFLNPSLSHGGETYFKWVGNKDIEFENNLIFPSERYSINIETKQIRKTGTGETMDTVVGETPIQSQRDEKWGDAQLGSCENQTIHSAGCAVSAVSMLLKAYGYDTDPEKLNEFLSVDDQGYVDGCNIQWYVIPNYIKGLRMVGTYFYEKTFERLDYQLEQGNPVIIGFEKVPFTNIPHWVVVTHKDGNTYYINDPWSLDGKQKTLDDFGGVFDHLIVYEELDGDSSSKYRLFPS